MPRRRPCRNKKGQFKKCAKTKKRKRTTKRKQAKRTRVSPHVHRPYIRARPGMKMEMAPSIVYPPVLPITMPPLEPIPLQSYPFSKPHQPHHGKVMKELNERIKRTERKEADLMKKLEALESKRAKLGRVVTKLASKPIPPVAVIVKQETKQLEITAEMRANEEEMMRLSEEKVQLEMERQHAEAVKQAQETRAKEEKTQKFEQKYADEEDEDDKHYPLDPKWGQATTFKDLLKLNTLFIRGKLKSTPYHDGPMELRDKTLMSKLLKLHKYGLLTDNGQDSGCDYGEYAPKTKLYVDEERKGYLEFFVNLLDNAPLIESLTHQITSSNLVYNIYNLQTNQNVGNVPKGKYNVTRERGHATREGIAKEKWNYFTNMPDQSEREHFDWSLENADRILNSTVHFSVALPDYCKGDVQTIILEMCKIAKTEKRKTIQPTQTPSELSDKLRAKLKAQMEHDENELAKLESKHGTLREKLDSSKPQQAAKIATEMNKVETKIEEKKSKIGDALSVLGGVAAGAIVGVGGVGGMMGSAALGVGKQGWKRLEKLMGWGKNRLPPMAEKPEIIYKGNEPYVLDSKTQEYVLLRDQKYDLNKLSPIQYPWTPYLSQTVKPANIIDPNSDLWLTNMNPTTPVPEEYINLLRPDTRVFQPAKKKIRTVDLEFESKAGQVPLRLGKFEVYNASNDHEYVHEILETHAPFPWAWTFARLYTLRFSMFERQGVEVYSKNFAQLMLSFLRSRMVPESVGPELETLANYFAMKLLQLIDLPIFAQAYKNAPGRDVFERVQSLYLKWFIPYAGEGQSSEAIMTLFQLVGELQHEIIKKKKPDAPLAQDILTMIPEYIKQIRKSER